MNNYETRHQEVSSSNRSQGRRKVQKDDNAGTATQNAKCKEKETHNQLTVGQRFTRLVVKERVGSSRYWICVCDCGIAIHARKDGLLLNRTKSCGCLHREQARAKATKHGYEKRPEYRIWQGMKTRCGNPKVQDYHRYGGRGIKVCERWLKFENFLEDMGDRPSPRHSIDRINNDLGYSPSNCRWALPDIQYRNKSTSRVISYNGQSLCLAQWERFFGKKKGVITARLRLGWSFQKAVSTP